MKKRINTEKLLAYNSFPSVYHLLDSGEWLESYEQKNNTWKTEWSSSRHSSSSRAFSKNLFHDKGRAHDLAVFQIAWKQLGSDETIYIKKFCIFRSFSAVYHLPHSDIVKITAKIRF